MCGIAGIVSYDAPIAPERSTAMSAALAHRGPDGEGIWRSSARDVVLVHRRLAIIDPGPGGTQPMATADGRHHLVFNGEIYNYRELRRGLESRGERFATGSDTEVLLRVLACEGPEALARVRGMFAFGWWDAVSQALVLVRDRFGIKPLYVARQRTGVAFASEIGALAAAGVASSVDPAGVLAYLAWGSVPPDLTWCAGVRTIEPGTWARWSPDGERSGRFAQVGDVYRRPITTRDPALFKARVGDAVQASVGAHLVADVPVGVFLSGGIDSSAIVSAATASGAKGLQTFTVRFAGVGSEHEYAQIVSKAFGTTHHELVIEAPRVASELPAILQRMDQPTLDGVNSYYVSKAVRETGIKAVLSGTGGDELFGGYPSFWRLPTAVRWKRRMGPAIPLANVAARLALKRPLLARWTEFASGNGRMDCAYRAQRRLFMSRELAEIAGPALRDEWRPAVDRLASAESALLRGDASTDQGNVARLETSIYLRAQLLRDLDAMSMAHGLEVRVPLVDHELLDAVWPDLGAFPQLLVNKRALHHTLQRQLPAAAVERPKQGFTLPFSRWIGGELQPFVRSGMDYLVARGWIAANVPDTTWRDWQRGDLHWSRVWALGVLGAFLERR